METHLYAFYGIYGIISPHSQFYFLFLPLSAAALHFSLCQKHWSASTHDHGAARMNEVIKSSEFLLLNGKLSYDA